jgi:NADH-quinone oxidoreductase subunit K
VQPGKPFCGAENSVPVSLANYVALASVMFFIGVAGVLLRRNPLIVLMSIELMFNAANILFVAFARAWVDNAGHIFAFLVITVAAAEAAIGLAIVVAAFREEKNVDVDEIRMMRG